VAQPLLYELNTRCWIEQVRAQHGQHIDLGCIPDCTIAEIAGLGFTHVWAMGVWTTGPLCRKHALTYWKPPAAKRHADAFTSDDDVVGSPYAVSAYRVAKNLGGEEGLSRFRRQLHRHGLRLILDFVPNHVAIDHHWLIERPELFVQSEEQRPETFRFAVPDEFTEAGARAGDMARAHPEHGGSTPWFAHGRDPYFAAWSDTAQLDYRKPETQQAMREALLEVAAQCDGVRCDMAMLLLSEVFRSTWKEWPVLGSQTADEFWPETIRRVKAAHSRFTFIAEVYWDREAELQRAGFDYTYEKAFYDLLEQRNYGALIQRLSERSPHYLERSLWFLENHDEQRVAARFSLPEHKLAAALLLLGLPGMSLIYEGQLEGWNIFVPVQIRRWPAGVVRSAEIAGLYQQLLTSRREARFHERVWGCEAQRQSQLLCCKWQGPGDLLALALNCSNNPQPLSAFGLNSLADRFSGKAFSAQDMVPPLSVLFGRAD